MKTRNVILRLLLAGLVTATLGGSSVRGDLLFSDSFDYPARPLAGQGPPAGAPPGQTGWSLLSGDPQVSVTGLHYPMVYSTGGGALLNDGGGANQTAVANLTPVNSGVVWLGFLLRHGGGGSTGYAVVNLTAGTGTADFPGYGVLFALNEFGIDNDGAGSATTNLSPPSLPVWLVVKLDFDRGTQKLYVNPTSPNGSPDAQLQMSSEFQAAGFNDLRLNIGLNRGATYRFDEVRVATTFGEISRGH